MSDPSNSTSSPFSFGQAAGNNASGQQSGGLFGNQNTSSNSSTAPPPALFGGGLASGTFGGGSQGGSSSIFGGTGSAGGGFGFGNKPDDKPASPSTLGGFATSNNPSTPSGDAQKQAQDLFGTSAWQATSGTAGSTTPAPSKSLFSLGNVSTTPAGPPPSTQSGGLFSFSPSQSTGSGNFLSGIGSQKVSEVQQPSQTATSGPSLFGGSPQTSTTTKPSSTPPLFGSTLNTSGPSLFGSLGKPQESKPLDSLHGQTSSSAGNASRPTFSFPSSSNQSSQPSSSTTATTSAEAPRPSLFGSAPSSAPSLGAEAPKANNLFGSAAHPSSSGSDSKPSLFGGAGQPAASSSAEQPKPGAFGNSAQLAPSASTAEGPKPSLFNSNAQPPSKNMFGTLEQKQNAGSAAPNSQISTTAAATTASAGTAPATSAPFGFGKPANSTATSQLATSTTTMPAGGGNNSTVPAILSGSTAGPAPGTQSRLKNRSMDEIITRWASDLSKYQKEFQAQGEKVAAWDRMLVENSGKISKLYSKTFQAERDMAEVEKQLTAVEGQQDELAMWLDRYEREVDEMVSRQVGQGEGLQGPDQERERTYKTAERISEQLNEMGKDLTSMIEEINAASAAISKSSKPDDPLSQIVRVLNGHLSQLQLIDEGAADLQAKVSLAQKESQRLSSSRHNGLGNDAADDFYRSYMSKR